MSDTAYSPGDRVQIKFDDDLGPIAGQTVTILTGPDEDGMYRVELTVREYVSADSIRS